VLSMSEIRLDEIEVETPERYLTRYSMVEKHMIMHKRVPDVGAVVPSV